MAGITLSEAMDGTVEATRGHGLFVGFDSEGPGSGFGVLEGGSAEVQESKNLIIEQPCVRPWCQHS